MLPSSSRSGRTPVFLYRWSNESFFSEFNHMLLGLLYCRLQKTQFALSTRYSPVFYRRGWQDFFEPFCPEMESWVLHVLDGRPVRVSARPGVLVKSIFRRLLTDAVQPLFYPNLQMLAATWNALRSLCDQETFVLSVNGTPHRCGLRAALKVMEREVWHYNAETANVIAARVQKLSLPKQYAALHIRRGDKDTEVPHTSEMTYVECLERVTSLRDVYVATDDRRCVENIQRLRPSWRVSFLCPKDMQGYYPEDFNRQSREERGRRSLLLLAETEIMKRAEVFVGTFSSGIGTYQGIARDHHTYGVDFDEWLFEGGL